jgi:CheY-like chemotaxis protein
MPKTVIDCGNCAPDHNAIRNLVQRNFDAVVEQTHGSKDTLARLRKGDVTLVCVNRKLDQDYSDGMVIIHSILADEKLKDIPVMLISNYEEHQSAAVACGAVPGFGKLAIGNPATVDLLKPYLE